LSELHFAPSSGAPRRRPPPGGMPPKGAQVPGSGRLPERVPEWVRDRFVSDRAALLALLVIAGVGLGLTRPGCGPCLCDGSCGGGHSAPADVLVPHAEPGSLRAAWGGCLRHATSELLGGGGTKFHCSACSKHGARASSAVKREAGARARLPP
jgi:hypothetical protein